MKKDLKKATDRVKVFEDEFEIEFDETIQIRDRAELYKAQTMEYQKRLERTEYLMNSIEKKNEISGKVIKTLQSENNDLKKKLEETIRSSNKSIDVEKLMKEIEHVQNLSKELGIEDLRSHNVTQNVIRVVISFRR